MANNAMIERPTAQQRDVLAPASEPVGGILQRRWACGDAPGPSAESTGCRKKCLGLQRKAASPSAVPSVPHVVHDVLRSPGKPLDASTRAFMEPRFGHDFGRIRVRNIAPAMSGSLVSHPRDESEREADRIADSVLDGPQASEPGNPYDFGQVRVHTGARAAESARAPGVEAFTYDRHIVFGAGRYAPSTGAGRHLLAHELTHYIQQRTTGHQIQRRLTVDPAHPGPPIAPATDPAAPLTASQRFTMMDTLIQSLCDRFMVDSGTGDVVPKTPATPSRSALVSSKPTHASPCSPAVPTRRWTRCQTTRGELI